MRRWAACIGALCLAASCSSPPAWKDRQALQALQEGAGRACPACFPERLRVPGSESVHLGTYEGLGGFLCVWEAVYWAKGRRYRVFLARTPSPGEALRLYLDCTGRIEEPAGPAAGRQRLAAGRDGAGRLLCFRLAGTAVLGAVDPPTVQEGAAVLSMMAGRVE